MYMVKLRTDGHRGTYWVLHVLLLPQSLPLSVLGVSVRVRFCSGPCTPQPPLGLPRFCCVTAAGLKKLDTCMVAVLLLLPLAAQGAAALLLLPLAGPAGDSGIA